MGMGETKQYFLGVDFGTQGVRCGVADEFGNIISVAQKKYKTYYPEPGWVTQKPEEWVECMFSAAKECLKAAEEDVVCNIKGLSVCATASTVVPVLQDGTTLMDAILWMDNRANMEANGINETKHEVLKYCGYEVSVEWLIPKVLWLKNNRRDIYDKAYKVVEQLDYINYILTGEWVASICQATCKGNYVEDFGKWNRSFFEGIRLGEFNRKLNTRVLHLGEPIAKLKKSICNRLRLPNDLIVYQGGIDAHISMLGIGVSRPGDMGIVMGSSFVHLVLSKQPMFSDSIWGPYNNAVIPGLYCLEGGQVSAGSIANWFIREFKVEGEDPFDLMMDEASAIPPGSKGVIALDYFQGNRTPYKDPLAKGVFYGLTLSHTRAHMYRSILEGVAYGMRNVIESMSADKLHINSIMACGGVTRNPLWLKIIADVCGKPINLTTQSSYAGILGCCIVAAVGSGAYNQFEEATVNMVVNKSVVQPDMQAHQTYHQLYEDYTTLYQQLAGLMHKNEKWYHNRF
jgi:FGGY-family pentulose kinase